MRNIEYLLAGSVLSICGAVLTLYADVASGTETTAVLLGLHVILVALAIGAVALVGSYVAGRTAVTGAAGLGASLATITGITASGPAAVGAAVALTGSAVLIQAAPISKYSAAAAAMAGGVGLILLSPIPAVMVGVLLIAAFLEVTVFGRRLTEDTQLERLGDDAADNGQHGQWALDPVRQPLGGHPPDASPEVGSEERHPHVARAGKKPTFQLPAIASERVADGVAPSSGPRGSTSSGSPYRSIGAAPRLARSADVAPPSVFAGSPPGHTYDGFAVGGLIVRCASHVGTSHMNDRKVRQDAYAVGQSADGQLAVMAIADGVGSQDWSSLGAHWASTTAVAHAVQQYDEDGSHPDLVQAVSAVSKALVELAHHHPDVEHPRSVSTTLVLASVTTDDTTVQIVRVGDSTAFAVKAEELIPLFSQEDNLGVGTAALPVSGPPTIEGPTTFRLDVSDCLLMTTDGIGDLLVHAKDVSRLFVEELRRPVSPVDFSSLVGLEKIQAHDDQTAIAAWWDVPAGEADIEGRS